MSDGTEAQATVDAAEVRRAYAIGRELMERAAEEAEALRAEAARYARQREREADLLVGKARRVLAAAEARASVIIATAQFLPHLSVDEVIDLDALAQVIAPGASVLHGQLPSRLDGLLASAIAHAVTDAFPEGVVEHRTVPAEAAT
jgi:hypothetical protein